MCGIFGWIPTPSFRRTELPPVADALFGALRERGPNDRGYTLFDGKGRCIGDETTPHVRQAVCMLGHTRLSIIDLSAAGHQPMFTADKRLCIVFNGEIYNYRELRDELRAKGLEFRTESDTEVLLQAYVMWGKGCLDRLNGMYAFALYDTVAQQIFCARDCFGIKPFFWSVGRNGFCFASEIPALLCIPGVSRTIDSRMAYEFLHWGQVEHRAETMIQGIMRLQPAHWLELDMNALQQADDAERVRQCLRLRRYWQVPLPEAAKISFADATQAVRETFLDSVRLHLRSDVPLGVALSGGIDSTAVACAVRHLEPDAELHTFSYIADDPALSEERWVDQAIIGCKAHCHKVCPRAEDLLDDMDHMVLRLGEPFATTSIYAQYSVMRLARQHGITVLLEGQGADELYAGYFGYLDERVATLIQQNKAGQAVEFLKAAAEWPGRECMVLRLLAKYGLCEPPKEEAQVNVRALLRLDALATAGIPLEYKGSGSGIYHSDDYVRSALADHLTWSNVPGLMRHGDRNAMSFSIENRVPFCTRDMATLALSLPEEYLINQDGCSKYVLREALRGLVPDVILDRRDKIGFEAPGLPWLQQMLPWLMQNFLSAESSFVDTAALLKAWKDIIRGTVKFNWFYWRVLAYLRWKQVLELRETV